MEFKILGSVEIHHDGRPCQLTAPKARQTLALLLSRANQLVDTATLIDELWSDEPPRSATTTTQTYIYQIRKMLRRSVGVEQAERILRTQQPGYSLQVSDDELDSKVFERLAEQGRREAADGNLSTASTTLQSALSLWRSHSALADVSAGRMLEAHVVHLEELRLRTLELKVQIEQQLGRHRELVPLLRSLVSEHPLNESFHAQLISSLSHAGRRGEALVAFQSLRKILNDELGLEPSRQLQEMQLDLLNGRERELVGQLG